MRSGLMARWMTLRQLRILLRARRTRRTYQLVVGLKPTVVMEIVAVIQGRPVP
jgi:hypothetical protein